jgi:hypothetical protein
MSTSTLINPCRNVDVDEPLRRTEEADQTDGTLERAEFTMMTLKGLSLLEQLAALEKHYRG